MHTVVVADDHTITRRGLCLSLKMDGFTVVAEASNGQEAVDRFTTFKPDLMLMDIRMPVLSGDEAIAAICRTNDDAKILAITGVEELGPVVRAMRSGARGVLLKNAPRKEICHALRVVAGGGRYLPNNLSPDVLSALETEALSERELDVLRLVARSFSNAEIADELNISESGVKYHLGNINAKLGTNERTQAVLEALRRGILSLN